MIMRDQVPILVPEVVITNKFYLGSEKVVNQEIYFDLNKAGHKHFFNVNSKHSETARQ
jgi:hypothetical protein